MRALGAQLRAEVLLLSRRGENILITVVVPVALLVFFAGVMTLPTDGQSPLDFLVPGILALAIVSTSMVSLGIATAFERYYGVLKRLIGSPLPRTTLLLSKTLSVLVLEVVQAILVLGVARLLFGWSPPGSLPLTALVLLVGSVAFAGLGLLMAGNLRAEGTLALANGLYLVFLLLGGFVFPLQRLPGALSLIAEVLPASALSGATRAALAGAAQDAFGPLVVLAIWAIVAGGAAAATFKAE